MLEKLEENDFEKDRAEQEIKNTLEYLGQRSGIFIPRGKNKNNEMQYAFTHLSFLEYFAARGMKSEAQFWDVDNKWEEYQGYIDEPWWSETFILFFEQLEQSR